MQNMHRAPKEGEKRKEEEGADTRKKATHWLKKTKIRNKNILVTNIK